MKFLSMIFSCRLPSIYTVHLKNFLYISIVRSFFHVKDKNRVEKYSRLSILMHEFESNKYENVHLTHYFNSSALKLSAINGFFNEAKQLHANVIKLGFYEALSMQNQVLYACVKCGEFWDVHKLFDEMPVRNIVSWNTVISGVVSSGELGFYYFRKMLVNNVKPDSTTFNALLRSNVVFDDLALGRQLHCFATKVGLSLDRFVGSAVVDLYGRLGLVSDAQCAFDDVGSRDLVAWNVMVSAYTLNGLVKEAIRMFRSMQVQGVRGDEFTYSTLLSSCNVGGFYILLEQLHGLVIKLSFNLDLQVASVLIDLYAKNGSVSDARKMFDRMIVQNLVTWNSMIVGYGQQGYGIEAVKLFVEMFRRNIKPDELTMASIVSSCGNLAAIRETSQVHSYVIRCGFDAYLSVSNSLIAAYSNCGSLAWASLCFDSITEPDLVTWTSILSAHAFHGHVEQGIKVFEMMLSSGLRLDNIAFLGILSACSHGGRVREGLHYFKLMTVDYDLVPSSEHYACLIGLLGHAGLVEEASSILKCEPVAPESNTLEALVRVSKACGQSELAEWAAKKLFELEPGDPVNYTLISNIHATIGQWHDVARVRKMMRQKCNSKLPGSSWIDIAGKYHTFTLQTCSDTDFVLANKDINHMLDMLSRPMKDDGFVDSAYEGG